MPKAVPKKLHFIWIGPPIPTKYINHILEWKKKNPDYEINLWIDTATTQPAAIKNALTQAAKTGARIRDINGCDSHLIENFINRDFYHEEATGKDANYAAASDFLRLQILYREGGIYLDTDLTVGKKPFGDQVAELGLAKPAGDTNDFLMALPDAEIVQDLIQAQHDAYRRVYANVKDTRLHQTIHAHRSWDLWKNRCDSTLDMTGSVNLVPVIHKKFIEPFLKQGKDTIAQSQFEKVYRKDLHDYFTSHSDQTWLDKGPEDKKAELDYFIRECQFRFRQCLIDELQQLAKADALAKDTKNKLQSLADTLCVYPENLQAHDLFDSCSANAEIKQILFPLVINDHQMTQLLNQLGRIKNPDLDGLRYTLLPRNRYKLPTANGSPTINTQFNELIGNTAKAVTAFRRELDKISPIIQPSFFKRTIKFFSQRFNGQKNGYYQLENDIDNDRVRPEFSSNNHGPN